MRHQAALLRPDRVLRGRRRQAASHAPARGDCRCGAALIKALPALLPSDGARTPSPSAGLAFCHTRRLLSLPADPYSVARKCPRGSAPPRPPSGRARTSAGPRPRAAQSAASPPATRAGALGLTGSVHDGVYRRQRSSTAVPLHVRAAEPPPLAVYCHSMMYATQSPICG